MPSAHRTITGSSPRRQSSSATGDLCRPIQSHSTQVASPFWPVEPSPLSCSLPSLRHPCPAMDLIFHLRGVVLQRRREEELKTTKKKKEEYWSCCVSEEEGRKLKSLTFQPKWNHTGQQGSTQSDQGAEWSNQTMCAQKKVMGVRRNKEKEDLGLKAQLQKPRILLGPLLRTPDPSPKLKWAISSLSNSSLNLCCVIICLTYIFE